MTNGTFRGVIRAGAVVLLEPPASLIEGTEVTVTPVTGPSGTGTAILRALEASPKVPAEWVDELELQIAAGRRPPMNTNPLSETGNAGSAAGHQCGQ